MTCPEIYAPVLATDGRTYDNDCLARAAGTSVVRRVTPKKLAGFGDAIAGVPNIALIAGVGIAAYMLLRRKRR